MCGFAHHFPSAPYPNAESTQVSARSPAIFVVSDREFVFFSPLTFPLFPLLVETINHNGPFRLRAAVITDPSLRPLLNRRCGRYHKPNVLELLSVSRHNRQCLFGCLPLPILLEPISRAIVCLPSFGCLFVSCVSEV